MEKRLILIGGAPLSGKSTIAKKLGEEMKVSWISTDSIRRMMEATVRKEDYPILFYFNNFTPEEYLKHSAKQIVKDQNKESLEVWKGVKALIDYDDEWEPYIHIVEGVAILPSLIHKEISKKKNPYIKPVFLLNNNEKRVRELVYKRGLWTDAKKYSDSLKEKEVEWVLEFNSFLKKELKKYKYPAIEFEKQVSLSEIKKYI